MDTETISKPNIIECGPPQGESMFAIRKFYVDCEVEKRVYERVEIPFGVAKMIKNLQNENFKLRGELEESKNDHAKAYLRKYANEIEVYRAVLLKMVNHYVSLVNSGDAGFWDPESEEPVIAARKALGDSE